MESYYQFLLKQILLLYFARESLIQEMLFWEPKSKAKIFISKIYMDKNDYQKATGTFNQTLLWQRWF
jgi:hypothetical protein